MVVVAIIFIIYPLLLILAIFLNPIIGKWLYPKGSEKDFKDAINEFDKTKKAIDDLDTSDYKLGSGHIY